MKKKIVLFLIHDLKIGGAEKQLIQLACRLPRDLYSPHIVTISDRGEYRQHVQEAKIPLHTLGITSRWQLPLALFRLFRLLRQIKPDILHTFLYYSDMMGRLTAKIARVPVLINTMRNVDDWRGFFHIHFDRLTSFIPNVIVSNSLAGVARLQRVEKIPNSRLRVIHNGIDVVSHQKQYVKGKLRSLCGLGESDFLLGCVGRLHPQKNHSFLLLSFAELLKTGKKAHLVLLGDGEEKSKLQKLVGELEISDFVTFAGMRSDVAELLGDLNLLVLSSDYEGLPNVIMEAGVHSIAVIATDVGGVAEVLGNDNSGKVITANSIPQLTRAMEDAMEFPANIQEMGLSLQKRISTRFSIDHMVKRHLQLYEELIPLSNSTVLLKRILLLITKADVGGAQKHVADLAMGLTKNGFTVEVAAGVGDVLLDYLNKQGIKTHFLHNLKREIAPLQDLRAFVELRQLFQKGNYDLIHCHSSKAGILGRIAARLQGIPVIFTAHGFVYHSAMTWQKKNFYRLFESIAARFGQGIITVSQADLNKANHDLAVSGLVELVYNGVDIEEREKYFLGREEGRNWLAVDEKTLLFGTIGRFCDEKAFDTLVKAVSLVAADLRKHKVQVHILGEGPLKKEIEDMVKDLAVSDIIRILAGPLPRCLPYRGFDGYLLSSRKEGFPYTLLEAGIASLPVVATTVGGITELIEEGFSGFVVPVEDAEALARGILRLAVLSAERRAKMGGHLRAKVAKDFTLEKMIVSTIAVYQKVLEGRYK